MVERLGRKKCSEDENPKLAVDEAPDIVSGFIYLTLFFTVLSFTYFIL